MSKGKLPVVLARATSQPPKKPSALALMGRGLEALTRKFVDAKADFARRLAAIEDRPAPVDGVGIAGGIIDQDGNLVLTLTSGRPVNVGRVVERPDAAAIAESVIRSLREEVDALRATLVAAAPTADGVQALVAEAVAGLPEPKPGKSVTVEEVRSLIADEVAQAVGKLPAPPPAVEVGAVVADAVAAELGELRAAIKAIELASELPDIPALIADAVAALPPPKPGKSVTVDDVRPLIESLVADLPKPEPGAPGVGLASALIDHAGRLVVTLSDGSTQELGPVVGSSVDERAVATMVDAAVAAAVEALPSPEPGKSVTIDDVRPVLADLVDAAVEALPAPAKGVDADPEVTAALVRDEVSKAIADVPAFVGVAVAEAVAALPPAEPGKSVDPAEVEAMVAEAVAALPKPKDGESVTLDDVRPLIAEAVAAIEIPAAEPGKDGVGVADMIVDSDGRLAVVLTDGKRVDAGAVVPEAKPGPPGLSIASGAVNEEGHLILVLSDESTIDVGSVKGEPGETVHGDPGRGVASAKIVKDELVLEFTDKTKANLGRVVGKAGISPKPPKALKGDPGPVGGLKVIETGMEYGPDEIGRLREITVETVNGEQVKLYARF